MGKHIILLPEKRGAAIGSEEGEIKAFFSPGGKNDIGTL